MLLEYRKLKRNFKDTVQCQKNSTMQRKQPRQEGLVIGLAERNVLS